MKVLMSLGTNNHRYRQLTVYDLTEWEPFSPYKFKKCKITTS